VILALLRNHVLHSAIIHNGYRLWPYKTESEKTLVNFFDSWHPHSSQNYGQKLTNVFSHSFIPPFLQNHLPYMFSGQENHCSTLFWAPSPRIKLNHRSNHRSNIYDPNWAVNWTGLWIVHCSVPEWSIVSWTVKWNIHNFCHHPIS